MRLSLSNPRTTQPWSQGDRNVRKKIHREKTRKRRAGESKIQDQRGTNEIHENGKPRHAKSPLVVDEDTRKKNTRPRIIGAEGRRETKHGEAVY